MKANALLKHNIDTLLRARGQTRKDLAQWCRRTESWISKIFRSQTREIPLKYLDRISDFFGIATYQLLQPGISAVTERRKLHDRRAGRDRRIGAALRQAASLREDIAAVRPSRPHHGDRPVLPAAVVAEVQRENERYTRAIDLILAKHIGDEAPDPRAAVPPIRKVHRAAGGSHAPRTGQE